MSLNPALNELLLQVKKLRVKNGLSTSDLEKRMILGPGWIDEFESGKTIPRLDVFISLLNELGSGLEEVDFNTTKNVVLNRNLLAKTDGNDLILAFPYGKYDAEYRLKDATIEQFNQVLFTLRNGLAGTSDTADMQIKANAVANAFLKAAALWPHANPSDLWWFVVYRAFLDTYNHPASAAKLNFDQSWKRTGGWALEKVLVKHYEKAFAEEGITALIAESELKQDLLSQIKTVSRIEADKADVLLTTITDKGPTLFGVAHVKASFAERRTDDVPLSKDLIEAGYYSPLWTMDCKSTPAKSPNNRGELGSVWDSENDSRSAKRKDIEEDGYFSSCFSYNQNTLPTPASQTSKSKIYVCNFNNPNDEYFKQTVAARDKFIQRLH